MENKSEEKDNISWEECPVTILKIKKNILKIISLKPH